MKKKNVAEHGKHINKDIVAGKVADADVGIGGPAMNAEQTHTHTPTLHYIAEMCTFLRSLFIFFFFFFIFHRFGRSALVREGALSACTVSRWSLSSRR